MYHVISNIRMPQNKNIKMLKFTDNSSDLYFLRSLQIPVIPRFLEIPKAIDTVPNRVGPLEYFTDVHDCSADETIFYRPVVDRLEMYLFFLADGTIFSDLLD